MYRFIEALGVQTGTVEIEGTVIPVPCIAEDDEGVRLLLLDSDQMPVGTRVTEQLTEAGVAYTVVAAEGIFLSVTDDGTVTEHDHAPDYLEVRRGGEKPPAETFVHLHTHSTYSALDGYSTVEEMIDTITGHGQTALGVTDHGLVAAHPEVYNRCVEAGITPVLGMEAYLQEDRFRRTRNWWVKVDPTTGAEFEMDVEGIANPAKEGYKRRNDSRETRWGYQHITLWAMNDVGLRNLWAMSTVAYRDGLFDGKPRLDYEVLRDYSEGVIASTGCLRGPIAVPIVSGDEQALQHNLGRLMDIFPDRLYVEIHVNTLEDQVKVNHRSVELARTYGLPMIGAVDSHYATPADAPMHQAWLQMTTSDDGNSESGMFTGDPEYHLMSEAEVRQALAYLGQDVVDECIDNTAALAARCTAKIEGEAHPPVYSRPSAEHPDPVERDVTRLMDLCLSRWDLLLAPKIEAGIYTVEEAEARFEHEMSILISKEFCGYFLLVADYVNHVRHEMKGMVGPGRGSGAGSLVAYLSGITGVDPIEYDLLFERFINPGRASLPDFDVDFETRMRGQIKGYLSERWGRDNTLSIGTVSTVKPRKAMDSALRILRNVEDIPKPEWSEVNAFKAAVQQSDLAAAGTEVSWEQFATDHEDLVADLTSRYPEVMGMVQGFVGRVFTYGKHAAGMVVSTTKTLTDLPMRVDEDGNLICQFDMNALEALGYVKFDILTVRNLDTIADTIALIKNRTGVEIDPERWIEEYTDPQVWDEIAAGFTLGMFQIETSAGTRVTKQVAPANIEELAAAVTINRPGPLRSGLAESYIERKHGREAVSLVDNRLKEALDNSYGVPIYQEQIMAICMILAGYSPGEADDVRRILGKKKVDQIQAAGRKFIPAAVERGVDRVTAERLWDQMAEFAKYGFNKSHAVGYSLLAYWTAWLKVHYPADFMTAVLGGIQDERVPAFIAEARRMGYAIAPPDVNLSGIGFTADGTQIRYGLSDVPGVGEGTALRIVEEAPYTSIEDFKERVMTKGSPVNAGHLRSLVHVGAFDSVVPNRRAVDLQLEAEATGQADTCIFKDPDVVGPNGLPCTFDWDNEVDPPMVSKGRGKNKVSTPKPPPARCTRACRNFTPPPPTDPATIEPYTEGDIRQIEYEVLGTYISSTPFDRLAPEDRERLDRFSDVASGKSGREYVTAAIIRSVRTKPDRTGKMMAFVSLEGEDGGADAVVFGSVYRDLKPHLTEGHLVLVALWKTDRGLQVQEIVPTQ